MHFNNLIRKILSKTFELMQSQHMFRKDTFSLRKPNTSLTYGSSNDAEVLDISMLRFIHVLLHQIGCFSFV